jgi:hypothetical protein
LVGWKVGWLVGVSAESEVVVSELLHAANIKTNSTAINILIRGMIVSLGLLCGEFMNGLSPSRVRSIAAE